ncbi:MAG: diguanylate cyclase [Spirochaetota bacterium]
MISADLLHRVAILENLASDELDIFRRFLEEVTCDPGCVVFRQGDEGHELYIVGEGTVSVRVRANGGVDVDVAQLGPGDFFGEMSIYEDAPRSATCVMPGGGRLFRLQKEHLFSLMSRHPHTATKVLHRMVNITTGRLTRTSSFLSDLVQWGENARRRAITDDLTGLYNRRYLDSALEQQITETLVKNRIFSLIMMDLDHFHAINDTYGQPFGDRLIASVAPPLRSILGTTGIAARYGGDEFTIILPGAAADEALESAEAIRRAVASLEVLGPSGIVRVTASQGIAEFPRHGSTLETIKQAADKALYRAKEAGRNRAILC